jgi:hypothetical protein
MGDATISQPSSTHYEQKTPLTVNLLMSDPMHALAQLGYPVFTHKQPADLKIMYHQSLLQKGNLRNMSFRPPGEISCFKARDFSLTLEMTTKNISTVFC